ncbi:MAG: hypothetical protein QNJ92_01295 [Alphaproteobacteria bacterium]|nr:hypothetical protein [Alphaproteobacteria bacterium]
MHPDGQTRFSFLTFLLVLTAAPATSLAGDYRIPVYPRPVGSEPALSETPSMKIGPRAANWLPRYLDVLRANRPPRFRLGTVALFAGGTDGRYLGVIWRGESIQTPRLEFHRFVSSTDGPVRMKYLRAFADREVDLVPPSGLEIFKGESPVAVVRFGSGGSGLDRYGLRLVQMQRNTVDITPDWAGRVVDVVDLDDDGLLEVVAIDPRWAGYFDGRGSAGPHLPVILARVDRAFVPACRTHAAVFRDWIKSQLLFSNDLGNPSVFRAEALASASLAAAQIGAFGEARRTFAQLEALYVGESPQLTFPPAHQVLHDYSTALDQAEQRPDRHCPASAVPDGGGHFGTNRRNAYFGFHKD